MTTGAVACDCSFDFTGGLVFDDVAPPLLAFEVVTVSVGFTFETEVTVFGFDLDVDIFLSIATSDWIFNTIIDTSVLFYLNIISIEYYFTVKVHLLVLQECI